MSNFTYFQKDGYQFNWIYSRANILFIFLEYFIIFNFSKVKIPYNF